jgi:CarD family transcriptional regulator
MMEFKIGDKLMHPTYGVGTLVSIEKQGNDGMATRYYVIELDRDQGRLATPVDKAEELGLRKPVSKEGRRKLSRLFVGRPRKLNGDPRKRRENISERLKEGNFVEVGWVVRDLAWRKSEGHANTGDRRLLKRAKNLLAEELAASDGIKVEEAMERIRSAIERRFSTSEDEED